MKEKYDSYWAELKDAWSEMWSEIFYQILDFGGIISIMNKINGGKTNGE